MVTAARIEMSGIQPHVQALNALGSESPQMGIEIGEKQVGAAAGIRLLSAVPTTGGIPTSLMDLGRIEVQSYDLSITAAANLSIPVIGSAGGSANRRVVVLEQAAYREVPENGAVLQYGYAVRFCVTVTKWDANLKLTLPFLAASAEVGSIAAHWTLQILGLAGPKIAEAILPPTELNVEKFVLAKQSLEKIIAAIQDQSTVFRAEVIRKVEAAEQTLHRRRIAVAETYGLSSLERGRSCADAARRAGYDTGDPLLLDAVRDIYRTYGIASEVDRPGDEVRRAARDVLHGIKADV